MKGEGGLQKRGFSLYEKSYTLQGHTHPASHHICLSTFTLHCSSMIKFGCIYSASLIFPLKTDHGHFIITILKYNLFSKSLDQSHLFFLLSTSIMPSPKKLSLPELIYSFSFLAPSSVCLQNSSILYNYLIRVPF